MKNLMKVPFSESNECFWKQMAHRTAIALQKFLPCFLYTVKSPVQMSGAGVRLILRSMSGSVQLKKLRLKSLTIGKTTFSKFFTWTQKVLDGRNRLSYIGLNSSITNQKLPFQGF